MTLDRRTFLSAGATAVAAGLAGCEFSSGPSQLVALSTGDGSVQWTRDLGDVNSGPIPGGGGLLVDSGDQLHALSPEDGSDSWTAEVEFGGIDQEGLPTVTRDAVVVPADESVVALSAADGSERWRFETDATTWVAPPVADGTVVVGTGDDTVYGVSMADGTEQWSVDGTELVRHSAAVVDSTALFTSEEGRVRAVDLATGEDRWTVETEKAVDGRPAVGPGLVYVGTEARTVYALSVTDGSEQWQLDTSGGVGNFSTSAPETFSSGGWLYALDNDVLYGAAPDGDRTWSFDSGDELRMTFGEAAVYVGADRSSSSGASDSIENWGEVYGLDSQTGEMGWTTDLGGKHVATPPGVGSDAVFVGQPNGTLHALERENGLEQWVYEADGEIAERRPVVTDGVVVVTI